MNINEISPGDTVVFEPHLESNRYFAHGKRTVLRIESNRLVILECGNIRLVAHPKELTRFHESIIR